MRYSNEEIVIMITGIEEKLDKNISISEDMQSKLANVTTTVEVHEVRLKAVERKQDADVTDKKWWAMAIIAIGSVLIQIIKMFTE